jgi:uncharacterized protein (TIGR03437 family)
VACRLCIYIALFLLQSALAQTPLSLTYIPGSSVKLYQVNGDCDWVQWDATITTPSPTCKPTTSRTETNADILGDDVPVVFENNGEMIVTFGDTIGAAGYSAWTSVKNTFLWQAHDPIARSTTANVSDGLLLNFFQSGTHGLEILPPPQPDGTPVDMGIDNTPFTGVSLNGTIYLGIKTGNIPLGDGNNDQSHDYSVLTTFNESTQTFTSGRTISSLPGGTFVGPTFYLAPVGSLGVPAPVSPEPVMLNFGIGQPAISNIYLSLIPASEFWAGVDASGNSATRYFSGMSNGQPSWSATESSAVPIVTDLNPTHPTVERVTVFYSQSLGLWLMIFNGGHNSPGTAGMYFTYAPLPWGPWSKPQLIFNDCRDKALGNYVFYYYATTADNTCPSAMPTGITSAPGFAGPAGPTIGDQTANNPNTTIGRGYSPELVGRFTTISGNTLKLYYMLSTWNPYTTVMMESDFTITATPTIAAVVNAESGSPIIAPGTWLEIAGSNLSPSGDSRNWQASDFVNGQMPTQLDGVSATVNAKSAYVAYISPTQVNILSPSDAISGPVQVVLTNSGIASAAFTAQAQAVSPAFFVVNGGPYVVAEHANGSYISTASAAKPGEIIVLYANGFGSTTQPAIQIGGIAATIQYAGTVGPGLYQINVVVPPSLSNGDQPITASAGATSTQSGTLITIHN